MPPIEPGVRRPLKRFFRTALASVRLTESGFEPSPQVTACLEEEAAEAARSA